MPEQTENNDVVVKQNFFKDLIKSIKDFDKYEDFAIEGIGRTLKYLVKILIVFCAAICIAYTYKIVKNTNNVYTSLKDKIPNFTYENGELFTENIEPLIIEDYGEFVGSIIIDTKTESPDVLSDYKDQIDKYGSGILILKNKIIVQNANFNGQSEYKYSDLLSPYNIQNGTKEQLLNFIEGLNIVSVVLTIFVVIFIYLLIMYLFTTIIDILMLSCLGYFSSRIFRIKIKFSVAFSVAMHALTLPIILNLIYILVNLFFAFDVKYFQIMYYTIAYIYVIVAILMIKTDFINRQAELIKIAQEQIKVKEELEKEEDKEKEEQKEEKKDKKEKNDNEKEKKQNKKKEKSPEEPIGDASSSLHESE